jgi:hypothetical protein
MYESPADPKESARALESFAWAFKNGNNIAYTVDYATGSLQLPPRLTSACAARADAVA